VNRTIIIVEYIRNEDETRSITFKIGYHILEEKGKKGENNIRATCFNRSFNNCYPHPQRDGHQVSYLNIYKASPPAYRLEIEVREAACCFVKGKFAEQRQVSSLLHVFFKETCPWGSSINNPYRATIFFYLLNF